ncbi:hypothetical protein L6452_12762 [Arctium lappa]|uniref:Uncharacterized protein n=1 Tax=Arctium lappa TaxID=4217 RepID=A0ACB9CGE6_ARCLA|nr:hypothetical protein L6452_12762 [Arctium lappa]
MSSGSGKKAADNVVIIDPQHNTSIYATQAANKSLLLAHLSIYLSMLLIILIKTNAVKQHSLILIVLYP